MGNSDQETARPKVNLYCNFCGKSQHEVVTLVAGPSVNICDECSDLCTWIVAERRQESHKELSPQEELVLVRQAAEILEGIVRDGLKEFSVTQKRFNDAMNILQSVKEPEPAVVVFGAQPAADTETLAAAPAVKTNDEDATETTNYIGSESWTAPEN